MAICLYRLNTGRRSSGSQNANLYSNADMRHIVSAPDGNQLELIMLRAKQGSHWYLFNAFGVSQLDIESAFPTRMLYHLSYRDRS